MMCDAPDIFRRHSREEAGHFASVEISNEWRDSSGSPVMVEMMPAEFVMGENEGDKFANDTERPAHRVTISSAFAIGKFPVTVAEFHKFQAGYRLEGAPDLPAVRVSWEDAMGYCEWLSEETGREYRLPSEAEWEFACRAGSRAPFACGTELPVSAANYLYDENGMRVGLGHRTRVGSFPANRFGLHDMHGNVCEWVMDTWHADYVDAPTDGSAWVDPASDRRVIRGGAWDYLPRLLRSSWRDWRLVNQRTDNVGFRVATGDLRKFENG